MEKVNNKPWQMCRCRVGNVLVSRENPADFVEYPQGIQADLARFFGEWFSDAPTLSVHTSGSTGEPKVWRVRKEQMMNSARITCEALGLRAGDCALLCMPLDYIAGKMVVVRALVAGLERHPQVFVLADEIYEHVNDVGAHQSIAQFPAVRDRVIIVNGVSKAYAMTGWRIGFIAAPLWIAKACNKLQGQYTSGASSIAQKAAAAAFAGDQSCVEEMRRAFERRRDLVVRLAREIPGLKVNNPDGAFYLFPEISCYLGKADGDRVIKTSSDLAMYILEVGHVATVAGDAFGAPNYLRLSYATSEENITEAMRRMKEVLARLK